MIEFAENKKKLSQVQRLAKELAKRPLTGMQIIKEVGILNYKGRIFDLRGLLWDSVYALSNFSIATKMIETKKGHLVAQYYLSHTARKEYKKFLRDFLK